MSCTNPSLLQILDIRKANIFQRKFLEEHGFKFSDDLNKAYKFAMSESRKVPLENCSDWIEQRLIEIPCGSCLACRLDRSQDWAVRCVFEASLWQHNYFVTLSYDDEHLCYGFQRNPTLVKEHIEDFIKTLRNYFYSKFKHTGIRYILCGEYNSTGERMLNPHFHLILFNCPIPDLAFKFPTPEGGLITKLNSNKMPMMYSQLINEFWGKGFITIDDANYNTEMYVSQYILKKQLGKSSSIYSEALGVLPPFLRMSNRPGIGFNSFIRDKDKYIIDPYIIVSRPARPIVTGLPKYFKRKLFETDSSLRDDFESRAKDFESRLRSIRANYKTTSNEQKAALESHLESLSLLKSRNFEN